MEIVVATEDYITLDDILKLMGESKVQVVTDVNEFWEDEYVIGRAYYLRSVLKEELLNRKIKSISTCDGSLIIDLKEQ